MDSYRLTLGGTTLDIGSYVLPEPGPDFDPGAVLKAKFTENPFSDGGKLAFEDSTTRTFKFTLRLASSGTFGGLDALHQLLRSLARPGAVIDVAPEDTATANTPRFDVLAGRVDETYSIYKQRADRREVTLELQVSPFGYLPTQIILASAASVGLPGRLAIPAGSVIGDVPGLAELLVNPTTGPTTFSPGSWYTDLVGWSIAGRASHQAFWQAASLALTFGGTIASVIGDFAAPASQAVAINNSAALNGAGAFTHFVYVPFVTGSGPFLEGRHRVFVWAKLTPSQNSGYQFYADLTYNRNAALASAQPVASLAPAVASGAPGAWGAQPSSGYTLLDLGMVEPDPQASAFPGATQYLRIWSMTPSHMVATQTLSIGGIYLLPQDGPGGVLPRGLAYPTITSPLFFPALDLDARSGRTMSLLASTPLSEQGGHYRGGMPFVGPSTVGLDLLAGHRAVASGATSPVVFGSRSYAQVSVTYRPRFAFVRGN